MKRLLFGLLFFLMIQSVTAGINDYTHIVELDESMSHHTIDLILDNGDLQLQLPPRIENLKITVDDTQQICDLEEYEGYTLLDCQVSQGKHFVSIVYDTSYPIFSLTDRLLYKSEYAPLQSTERFDYILKFPMGYILPTEKDISFFVNPKPKRIYSDGQRIILSWQQRNLTEVFEISVMMRPVQEKSYSWILLVGAILLAFGLGYFMTRKKQKTPTGLIEHEQTIVDLLASEGWMWQKQIQIKSGFSKVKVSRVLRSLEQRGVIRKEPWGNTNKIHLAKEPQKD